MNRSITTAPFPPVTPSAYIGLMVRRLLARRWWLFAVPAALMAAGAATDWRIAVIGLMLTFIVYPMAMSLVLLSYALSPDVIAKSRTAIATFSGKSIMAGPSVHDYLRPGKPLKAIKNAKKLKYLKFTIKAVYIAKGRLIAETGDGIPDIIIIPADSLKPEELNAVIDANAAAHE